MKKWKITDLFRTKKHPNLEEDGELHHKKSNYSPLRTIGKIATKTKIYLKAHFPKRVWSKPQEDRKGPKV